MYYAHGRYGDSRTGVKIFQLLIKFQIFTLNFHPFKYSNKTSTVNYFYKDLVTLDGNIFLYDGIMKLLHLLSSLLCTFFVKEVLSC